MEGAGAVFRHGVGHRARRRAVGARSAIPDPGRSPDAAFVAKASDATAVDAELATLALSRARAAGVKAFAQRVLDSHAALARELGAMGRTSPIAGAPRAEPVSTNAPAPQTASAAASADAATAEGPPPDGMKAVAVLRSQPQRPSTRRSSPRWSRAARRPWPSSRPSPATAATQIKEWAARQLPALREQLVAARALRPRPSS